jgi:uncharacterized protein YndB with AHSA1/START domain
MIASSKTLTNCGRTMSEPSISVSRDIPASAERIFSLLARPVAHRDVDGSGMLRSALDDVEITKVGDAFSMNMFNDEMGDYVMENHVVEFEQNRRIVWEPVMCSTDNPELQADIGVSALQQWGWQLEPLDASHTRVTEFFDCSHPIGCDKRSKRARDGDLRSRPVSRISRD